MAPLVPCILHSFLVFFFSLLLQAFAEVQYRVISDEHAQSHQRLMLILLDGFRYDYLEHKVHKFPGFREVINRGARPKYMIPDFPTLSYPNYYSFMTGLHTEAHSMTGNYMYDVKRKESFLIGSNKEQYHSHWWNSGEPLWVTAVKQNRTSHMYYWPGCEVEIRGFKPTFCRPYKGVPTMDDFRDATVDALKKLQFQEADVVGIYFELTDTYGHNYGPGSEELMQLIIDLDPIMAYLADSLPKFALNDVNLMILSDHGMTSVDRNRVINLNNVMETSDYDSILTDVAVANIYTKPGKEDEVYKKLKGFHPNLTVYRKNDIPDRWRYKHGRYVAPLTGVADLGWFILAPDRRSFPSLRDGSPVAGWHGFDNNNDDMMGLFIGMGPAFRQNVLSDPIRIVDLYQIMCHVLRIEPSAHSGSWSRVADIVTFEFDISSAMPSRPVTSYLVFAASGILFCVMQSRFCALCDFW